MFNAEIPIPEVTFGTIRSYTDWGVFWNGMTKEPPKAQKSLIKVPFRHGLLNVTKALTDKIFYENRKISFHFEIVDMHEETWSELYSRIMDDVHGQEMHVVTDTDPDYYWETYDIAVSQPSMEEGIGSFDIECDCFPYKMKSYLTTQTVEVTGQGVEAIFVNGGRMEVNPTFTATADVQMIFTKPDGSTATIAMSAGTHTFDAIEFIRGENSITFNKLSSNSSVEVSYREGDL